MLVLAAMAEAVVVVLITVVDILFEMTIVDVELATIVVHVELEISVVLVELEIMAFEVELAINVFPAELLIVGVMRGVAACMGRPVSGGLSFLWLPCFGRSSTLARIKNIVAELI